MATLRCPVCGWTFLRESALRTHLETYHPGAQSDEPAPQARRADELAPTATPERAGWYPDPTGEGTRYWDGSRWVDTTSPPEPPVSRGWLIASYVAAVLLPIAGLIAGIVVFVRGMRGHGLAVIAISVAIGAVGVVGLKGNSGGGGRSADDQVQRALERSRQATNHCLHERTPHAINKCINRELHGP